MDKDIKAEIIALLKLLADDNNWCYIDESGCPKGVGQYRDSWYSTGIYPDHPQDHAKILLDKLGEKI